MSGRPEILFPLFAEVTTLAGVGAKTAQALAKIAITKPRDLLFNLPNSGIERQYVDTVRDSAPGTYVIVEVQVGRHIPARSPTGAYRVEVDDAEVRFQLVFFRAKSAYLSEILPTGQRRIIVGKLEHFDGVPQLAHPDVLVSEAARAQIKGFESVYPLTAGVSKRIMAKATGAALERLMDLPEWIEPSLLAQEAWPSWRSAVEKAHDPMDMADLGPKHPARARLAYDEVFAHQLTLALARSLMRRKQGRPTVGTGRLQAKLCQVLPFEPTSAQERAVADIIGDMSSEFRMNRLLQGDVGSGKTLVAFWAMVAAVEAGGQAVMMAPTEILARQHMQSLKDWAEPLGLRMACLTGRDKGTERVRLTEALARGEIDILLGTHAVFQSDVTFCDLRLAIIDEQHRFGVRQRLELGQKGQRVDMLVMTATPIPRSLALAHYGDMDISLLDEKPPGRKPITTAMISSERLHDVIAKLRAAIASGQQAYWVCPLVEESEVLLHTAAEERFKTLRAALGDEQVGLVHGQMPTQEKDRVMADFVAGTLRLLVATTVIEVGVNVPNATIMVIEGADRFGLAQLHQLRGRVGRGSEQSTCLLMYQPKMSDSARDRLKTLRDTEDGFVLAEADLRMRGAGDVIGTAQSGLPRFRIANLETQADLLARAQKDARLLLVQDPQMTSERGAAARILLWLMEQDRAISLIGVG